MSNVITPKDGNVFIATYGSLRRGMQNFSVNARGGGEYVATGESQANYNLYRYGSAYFPSVSLIHSNSGTPVVLDIFEAPELGMTGAYDSLEGYPSFYNRTPIEVLLDNGDTLLAWIYHIDEEQEEVITSGDWCAHNVEDYYKQFKKEDAE